MREATSAGLQLPISTPSFLKYQTLAGYFLQDDPKTDPVTFDFVGKPVATAFPMSLVLAFVNGRRLRQPPTLALSKGPMIQTRPFRKAIRGRSGSVSSMSFTA
jgi:hypothetical protein